MKRLPATNKREQFAHYITICGNWYVLIPIGVLFSLAFTNLDRDFIAFWLGWICLTVVVQGLKLVTKKERNPQQMVSEGTYAFPSGHSSMTTYVYGWILLLAIEQAVSVPSTIGITAILACIIGAVGWSRVALKTHDWWDVGVGYVIGIVFLVGVGLIN